MKSRKEQVWFVALVFLGTGAVSVLAYLGKIGDGTNERAVYPFVEASANTDVRPTDLEPGLSKHYFNRQASSPKNQGESQSSEAREHTPKAFSSQALSEKRPASRAKLATQARKIEQTVRSKSAERQGVKRAASPEKNLLPATSKTPEKAAMNTKREPRAHADSNRGDVDAIANVASSPPAVAARAAKKNDDSLPPREAAPTPHVPSGTTPATINRSNKVEVRPPSHGALRSLSNRVPKATKSGSNGPHATRGWLPPRDRMSRTPAESPLRALVPTGQGWTDTPSEEVQKKTRFAEVARPSRPGAGPIFATSRHPGLIGVLDGHDEPIHALRFAPSGDTIVSASENGQVRHWDAHRGIITQSLTTSSALLLSADWSRDWQTLALVGCSSGACALNIRAMDSGKSLQEIAIERAHIGSVALSPDGNLAAVATDAGRISVTALGTAHQLSWQAHDAGVWSVAFDPFGRYLATGGMDYQLRIWEPRTGALLHTLKGAKGAIHSIAFAPNGLYVAAAGTDSIVRIYRASTGKLVHRFTGHLGTVRSIAFDESGRRLASAGDHSIRVWEMNKGAELLSIGWDFAVTSLAFSPDGTKLLAGDVVGLLTLWNAQIGSGTPLQRTAAR